MWLTLIELFAGRGAELIDDVGMGVVCHGQ
jgi:hypothetical protein